MSPAQIPYSLLFLCLSTLSVARGADDLPGFVVDNVEVGKTYVLAGGQRPRNVPGNTWGVIIQVVDDDNVIVGADNGKKPGKPRYGATFWVETPTKGMVDDKEGFLSQLIGTKAVKVTGTKRYETASGSTKTVYVLKPVK